MKDGVVERGIGGMAVRFPTAIGQVELDRAANWFAAIDPDDGVGKIGAGFAVPGAELDDLDFVAGDRNFLPKSPANQRACNSSSFGVRSAGKSARSWTRAESRSSE